MCSVKPPPPVAVEKPVFVRNPFLDEIQTDVKTAAALRRGRSSLVIPLNSAAPAPSATPNPGPSGGTGGTTGGGGTGVGTYTDGQGTTIGSGRSRRHGGGRGGS